MASTFENIEQLKREYSDKYVVVIAQVPELARFQGLVGQVKTVNMSGRALVQFDAWNNIGWYDIDPECLKVVPKPEPRVEEKKPAKPAPKAAGSKNEDAGAEKPVVKPAAGAKSTADILAAARAKGGAPAGAAPAKPAAGEKPKLSTSDILAAARAKAAGAQGAPAEKPAAPAKQVSAPAGSAPAQDPKKMSTADILAAARAKKAAEAAPAAEAASETEAEAEPIVETAPPAAETAAPVKAAPRSQDLPTTTTDKIAWCRAHDGK